MFLIRKIKKVHFADKSLLRLIYSMEFLVFNIFFFRNIKEKRLINSSRNIEIYRVIH
jgi:hypothetical protein